MSKRFYSELMSQEPSTQTDSKKSRVAKASKKGVRVPAALKKYVSKAITANEEKKYSMIPYFADITLTDPVITTVPMFMDLQPVISQGDGVSSRAGAQVKVASAWFNYRLNYKISGGDAASSTPLNVYMMIARPRSEQNSVTSTEALELFYVANNTTSTFDSGDAQAPFFMPNNDFWDVRYWTRKPLKLGNASGAANRATSNNDYNLQYDGKIDMAKIFPKTLKFSNSGTVALNANWYCLWFVQRIDRTTTPDPIVNAPEVNAQLTIKFTDA